MASSAGFERRLRDDMRQFYADPLAFVQYVFPWGVRGTALEDEPGPDTWQVKFLENVRQSIEGSPYDPHYFATRSGHGIGKSAITAWLILWAMSTRPHISGVVTANTFTQLNTKTWRELAVWHKRALNAHWFTHTATKFYHNDSKTDWYFSAENNSEENSEAFAGRHARYVVQIYDEASAIPAKIYEVSEGALTTRRSLWFIFGNPTRNSGKFNDCFTGRDRRWDTTSVSCEDSRLVNRKWIDDMRDAYGEESDIYRVRVLGLPPRVSSMEFIPQIHVDAAVARDMPYEAYSLSPLVMSVDVARGGDEDSPRGDFGGDNNVIVLRRGGKLLEIDVFPGRGDVVKVAREVQKRIKEHHPSAVFIDEVGLGYGIVDLLRNWGHRITGVNAHKEADDADVFFDKRMEMWDRMRRWLQTADIPDDPALKEELVAPLFGHTTLKTRGELVMLEKKKHTRAKLGRSPDRADALAYSFYHEMAGAHQSPLASDTFGEAEYEPEEAWL